MKRYTFEKRHIGRLKSKLRFIYLHLHPYLFIVNSLFWFIYFSSKAISTWSHFHFKYEI